VECRENQKKKTLKKTTHKNKKKKKKKSTNRQLGGGEAQEKCGPSGRYKRKEKRGTNEKFRVLPMERSGVGETNERG